MIVMGIELFFADMNPSIAWLFVMCIFWQPFVSCCDRVPWLPRKNSLRPLDIPWPRNDAGKLVTNKMAMWVWTAGRPTAENRN